MNDISSSKGSNEELEKHDLDKTNNTLSEEDRLRHEIKYLSERVTNLQVFKQNFFLQHHELVAAQERIGLLEEQLSLDKVKHGFLLDTDNVTHETQEHSPQLLDYFHDCLTASSYQDLVMSLFSSSENISSNVSLIIYDHEQDLNFSDKNESRENNLKLLNENKNNGELVQIDNHYILNYKHISLVYTYQDTDDKASDKQKHEFMEIITLGANSRISNIKQRNQLEQLRKNIYHIFKKTNKSFASMQNSIDENTINISEIYQNTSAEIIDNLSKMNIKDSDLTLIKLILEDSRSQLLLQLTSSMTIDQKFMVAMQRLEESYAKQYADN